MDATFLRTVDAVDDDTRVLRLAEMVQHITDCAPAGALHAMRRSVHRMPQNADESLAAVARAIVAVKQGIDLTDEIKLD